MKLLAPTVLVSLALVAACIFGLFYLNDLHVEASDVLSENEKSTRAAMRLETSTRGLIHLLQEPGEGDLSDKITEQSQQIQQDLNDAQELANWEEEKELVQKIRRGLETFDQNRIQLAASSRGKPLSRAARGELANLLEEQVLAPSTDLQRYNSRQIEESDRRNRRIVTTLKWGLVILGIGVPLSGLLLGYAVARSLHHSIYQLSVGIQDAAGRLNRTLGSVTLEEEGDRATLPNLHRRVQEIVREIERVVNQLQQREREVVRAEQLAAVGQVAAGVAHELRNPLTSIKMLVQTGLEGHSPSGLPAEDLSVVENEVRRMEQCIQVFLDFARPPTPERRDADLTEVLRRALALVEGRARRQNVTVNVAAPTSPLVVKIDPEQIHQVLVNLLLNALDALPHGGAVDVELHLNEDKGNGSMEPIGDGWAAKNHWVEVRIRDNGSGISPRIRQRLFEPFVSSKETGLGLGLSICKRLIEDHGGAIRGDNLPQGGAEFAFTLPKDETWRPS